MPKKYRPTLIYFCFISTIYLLNYRLINSQPIDANHTGLILFPIYLLEKGINIYEDIRNLYNPFFSYISNFILLFAKNNYLNIIKLNYFFYYIISLLVFFQGVLIKKPLFGFLSSILIFILNPFFIDWIMPWPNVLAILFMLLSINFFILFLQTNKNIFFFISIFFSILVLLVRDHLGLLFIVSYFFNLIIISKNENMKKFKILKFYFFNIVINSFIFVIFLNYIGSFNLALNYFISLFDFIIDGNIWKSKTEGFIDYLLRVFFPLISPLWNVSIQASVLPAILLVYIFRNLFTKQKDIILFSLCVLSLSSWIQYFPLPDLHHTYWGYTPMINISLVIIFGFINIYLKINFYKILFFVVIIFGIFSKSLFINSKNYAHLKDNTGRYFDNYKEISLSDYCTTNIKDSFYYGIKDTCDNIKFYDSFYNIKNNLDPKINNILVIGPYPIFYIIFDELKYPYSWYNNIRLVDNPEKHIDNFLDNFIVQNETLIIVSDVYIELLYKINYDLLGVHENIRMRNSSFSFEGNKLYLLKY